VVERRAAELGCPLARLGREIELEVEIAAPDATRLRYREGELDFAAELRVPGGTRPPTPRSRWPRHGGCSRRSIRVARGRRARGAGRDAAARARRDPRARALDRGGLRAHGRSAHALAAVLARLRAPVDFVLSVSAGKDTGAILAALLPLARSLTLTRAEPVRSLDPRRSPRRRARCPRSSRCASCPTRTSRCARARGARGGRSAMRDRIGVPGRHRAARARVVGAGRERPNCGPGRHLASLRGRGCRPGHSGHLDCDPSSQQATCHGELRAASGAPRPRSSARFRLHCAGLLVGSPTRSDTIRVTC